MSRARARRGFTLVELMIVVAIIGVLSALAIVGYKRYLHSAASGEAMTMIQAIRGGQEAYKSEMLTYLDVSAGSLTAYYPRTTLDDKKAAWINTAGNNYANWQLLNVKSDGPVRFGYACVAGVGATLAPFAGNWKKAPSTTVATTALNTGTPWYVIQASGHLNPSSSKYEMFGATSLGGDVYSETE